MTLFGSGNVFSVEHLTCSSIDAMTLKMLRNSPELFILLTNAHAICIILAAVSGPAVMLFLFSHVCYDILHDYRLFLSLGPGGTPSTIAGYLRIKFLELFALSDPYQSPPLPIHFQPQSGYLSEIRTRPGERPHVRGIAPHRQTNQHAPAAVFALMRESINVLAEHHPDILIQGTSCLEKHGPGLFVAQTQNWTPHCSGEVCHAHPSDGSLHLTLHPADAAIILKAKRGERHPLSSGGWLRRFVPAGFVMVYAPRTDEEVEIVMEIVKAAVWWISGTNVDSAAGNMVDLKHQYDESKPFKSIEVGCGRLQARATDSEQTVL